MFLPGISHGQKSLVDYSPWGHGRVGHNLATKQQWRMKKKKKVKEEEEEEEERKLSNLSERQSFKSVCISAENLTACFSFS